MGPHPGRNADANAVAVVADASTDKASVRPQVPIGFRDRTSSRTPSSLSWKPQRWQPMNSFPSCCAGMCFLSTACVGLFCCQKRATTAHSRPRLACHPAAREATTEDRGPGSSRGTKNRFLTVKHTGSCGVPFGPTRGSQARGAVLAQGADHQEKGFRFTGELNPLQ